MYKKTKTFGDRVAEAYLNGFDDGFEDGFDEGYEQGLEDAAIEREAELRNVAQIFAAIALSLA